MSKLDKDDVIAKFTEAYKAKHGKEPSIEAKGGWYSVDGDKNVRLAALDEMTQELGSSSKAAKPAKKKADSSSSKKEDKKADKKPAAKKSAAKKTKKTKGSSGFSVKEFWVEKIESQNPGSKHPR